MSNARIEQLLTEIRDLQAETLELMRAQGTFGKSRTDMVLGNVSRSRFMAWFFVMLALAFVLLLLLKQFG